MAKTPSTWYCLIILLFCGSCGGGGAASPHMPPAPPPVPLAFSMTNAASGNSVQVYRRDVDGQLVSLASVATGGTGVGHGLENQGALALSGDGKLLYVVNPGSDDLSVFRVDSSGTIELADRVSSGGSLPVSVAEWGGIVYVLNRHAAGAASAGPVIQGFQAASTGKLSPVSGATLALHATDTSAAQIGISPDGAWIIVTERGASTLDVIPLLPGDKPGTPQSTPSSGGGPFGFAFSSSLRLYVAEATAGTTSAYALEGNGTLRLQSASIPTQQRATCWLAIVPGSDLVYVTNTPSSSISSYRTAADGTLTRLFSVAATTSGKPLDLITSADGKYLSVLTADGTIESFRIDESTGALSSIQTLPGLPAGANGLIGG
jgi:6-phosphogluconolactonase